MNVKQLDGRQREWWVAGVAISVAVVAVVLLVGGLGQNIGPTMLGDLEIYRGAISWAWAGHPLYQWVYTGHPTVSGLGFTYPPFAAVAMGWVTWWDLATVKVIWTAAGLIVGIAAVAVLVRTMAADKALSVPAQLAWTAGLSAAFLFSYPVLHDLFVGQVSLFIVALVLFDHLLPRRWQGVLIGLAAAIKLTPLVFVPYFLVTRQWRPAVVSTATFLTASLVAAILFPRDSLSYWTQELWGTGRIGDPIVEINKSLLGLVRRTVGSGVGPTVVWVVLVLAVTALAFWQARRSQRAGDVVGATLLIGVLSLAISPISWPHHLVWLSLVACWWLLQQRRTFTALALVLLTVLMIYPAYFTATPEFTPPPVLVELPTVAVLMVLIAGSGRVRPAQGTAAPTP